MNFDVVSSISVGIAIATPLCAYVVARAGLGGRIRTMTYLEKRLALIHSLLREHTDLLSRTKIEGLKAEIDSIAGMLVASKNLSEYERLQGWRNGSFWSRIFTLPKPANLWEWVTTLLFYFSFWAAVVYFLTTFLVLILLPIGDVGFDFVTLVGLGSYWLAMCILMRRWRLTLSIRGPQSI